MNLKRADFPRLAFLKTDKPAPHPALKVRSNYVIKGPMISPNESQSKEIAGICLSHGLELVVLYGSGAGEGMRPESDVDLAVLLYWDTEKFRRIEAEFMRKLAKR